MKVNACYSSSIYDVGFPPLLKGYRFLTGTTERRWPRKTFIMTSWRVMLAHLWEHQNLLAVGFNKPGFWLLYMASWLMCWSGTWGVLSVTCAMKISNGNELFRNYSSVKCGKTCCHINFFLLRIVGGWSTIWVHSARRPLNGLLYLPQVIMMMEKLVEWRLAGKTEVLGENLPQRHFVHHKSHLARPGLEPGPPRWEASD
jgi:hypothetical protein